MFKIFSFIKALLKGIVKALQSRPGQFVAAFLCGFISMGLVSSKHSKGNSGSVVGGSSSRDYGYSTGREVRDAINSLQREQREAIERTVGRISESVEQLQEGLK